MAASAGRLLLILETCSVKVASSPAIKYARICKELRPKGPVGEHPASYAAFWENRLLKSFHAGGNARAGLKVPTLV
jgi:hypothetical protein